MDFFALFFIVALYFALREKYEDRFCELPGCMAVIELILWLISPILVLILVAALFG